MKTKPHKSFLTQIISYFLIYKILEYCKTAILVDLIYVVLVYRSSLRLYVSRYGWKYV